MRVATKRLSAAGIASARVDAMLLLAEIAKRDAAWFLAHGNDELDADAYARFESALQRRERGEPVAYITGSAGFYGRSFVVTPDVLVPRPETEELLERALAALRARSRAESPATLCDVGTGSGILAITAACELRSLHCTALDVSAAALGVARRNATVLGVAERVDFLASRLLDALPANARFDCIVANLPYVETAAIASAPDPVSFEPSLALDGGADGLDLYRKLLPTLAAHLHERAMVYFEAGSESTLRLADLATAAFPRATIAVYDDYAHHPRIVEIAF